MPESGGLVEGVRKAIQDSLAPELRAIDTRLKNLEQMNSALKMDLQNFRNEVQTLFHAAEQKRVQQEHQATMTVPG